MPAFMRLPRSLLRRPIKQLFVFAFVLGIVFDVCQVLRCQAGSALESEQPTFKRGERVYISSIHWNNEAILRSHWNKAVVALAKTLGSENVFVTVFESGSWDNSKAVLKDLEATLAANDIRSNITLSEVTHEDEISIPEHQKTSGWVDTSRGQRELRRIPYLSRLRNWTLQPLLELTQRGEKFDKVLFLNDVVFTTDDVLRLLDTNGGEYGAACSLDFSHPPNVYDTFALRDAEGHEMLTQTWPYFRARESRRGILENGPTPVTSCWNGMVAMPAEPFSSGQLRFRGISDSLAKSHLEGSECCLIHVDNPLRTKGTYVNPQVRVGYNGGAYTAVHPHGIPPSFWGVYKALLGNRIRRWSTTLWLKEWGVRRTVAQWRRHTKEKEAGEICLINEMQVLVANGWAHV